MKKFEKKLMGNDLMNHVNKVNLDIEYNNFVKLQQLIKEEMETYEKWRSSLHSREERLKEIQKEIEKKVLKTEYDNIILEQDINDILTEKDDNNIQFEEEISKLQVALIYTNFEILVKKIFLNKTGKKLSEKYWSWEQQFKEKCSINFSIMTGYYDIQQIRLFNNNYKHTGSILSKRTVEEIYEHKLITVLNNYVSASELIELKKLDKDTFVNNILEKKIRIILDKNKLLLLHKNACVFLHTVIDTLFP